MIRRNWGGNSSALEVSLSSTDSANYATACSLPYCKGPCSGPVVSRVVEPVGNRHRSDPARQMRADRGDHLQRVGALQIDLTGAQPPCEITERYGRQTTPGGKLQDRIPVALLVKQCLAEFGELGD